MATPATRDIEIEILAGLQELLAQQAVALTMMGRLHKSVDTWVQRRMQETMAEEEETEIERGRSRSRSPPRASAASDRDRQRFQQRVIDLMSATLPMDGMPVAEAPTIPGITMAAEVLPEQVIAAETVDPTLIRN